MIRLRESLLAHCKSEYTCINVMCDGSQFTIYSLVILQRMVDNLISNHCCGRTALAAPPWYSEQPPAIWSVVYV